MCFFFLEYNSLKPIKFRENRTKLSNENHPYSFVLFFSKICRLLTFVLQKNTLLMSFRAVQYFKGIEFYRLNPNFQNLSHFERIEALLLLIV